MPRGYFGHLNYSLGDEDSTVEMQMLPAGTDHVVAVAGSGGRVIPLLAKEPKWVTCVDISDTQLALTELRVGALRVLAREEYLAMLGYTTAPASERARLLRAIPISDSARRALGPLLQAASNGERIIYQGRFERMLRTLSRINAVFTRARGRGLFQHGDLADQRTYMEMKFPNRAWKLVLMLLGNSTVLNSLLYRGDFPKKNRPESAYAIYQQIFHRLFHTMVARKSFFLQMVFFGELRYAEGFPVECSEDVYQAAQRAARSTRIEFLREDIVQYVHDSSEVGFVSLSDVPSFLPLDRERGFLSAMKAGLSPGALIAMRGHLRVVEPDAGGFTVVGDEFSQVISEERTQLWKIEVYRKGRGQVTATPFKEGPDARC